MSKLPVEIGQLVSLQVLSLEGNQLGQLPAEVGRLTNLRVLSLGANLLSELPVEIGQLVGLQEITLGYNRLSKLPAEIGQLISLQKLILSSNLLDLLPIEIGQLTNLRILFLSDNQLFQLPSNIGQLTRLQVLLLDRNQLRKLPIQIGQLNSLQELILYNNQLVELPAEIGQLTILQRMSLTGNQLRELPSKIGQLISLQDLFLIDNQLDQLPVEIGQLISLQELSLSDNQLKKLPAEIGQLTSLQALFLDGNQLVELPSEIGQLSGLQQLSLSYNQLVELPAEIGQLASLQVLSLSDNRLRELPIEIGQLTGLQQLSLSDNLLEELPTEIMQLTGLQVLYLYNNRLRELPTEIEQLTNLQLLSLSGNQLRELSIQIGRLTGLQVLYLYNNQLRELPAEVSQLTGLQGLYLNNNQLIQLPAEIGQLTSLQVLSLDYNPSLQSPPPEIIAQGISAILTYLRGLQENSTTRYEAKLLIVGEGGTGKSSLLRALRNQNFDTTLSTTHGIEVASLVLPHPNKSDANIVLNTWDFGGQQIYHATHQFFLTKRSMYLVAWNARLGVKQGRLDYWLETIQALAPDAPVLLVATHIDERAPDINYRVLKEQYPQLVGQVKVSNARGLGIADLRAVLPKIAVQLPIMGQPWPATWSKVEEHLLQRPEHLIPLEAYVKCCEDRGVEEDVAKGTLGSYLHDLGKILYFQDDFVLSDLVVLKPNWITKAISRVLTDKEVSDANGILQHSELRRIWQNDDDGHPYQQRLYPVFLRLMERFYLSYQIEADTPGARSTRSLIPQLLPYQPPAALPPWPSSPPAGQTQIEMRYQLSIVPSGIMSWFIVRTHLYTQGEHWREGVLLTYQDHFARVELNENRKEIRLLVWGTQPHNFFTILMNTIDVILDFFSGLTIRREVPCICHWQRRSNEPCPHFFSYEELKRRIHTSTDPQVMQDIQTGQQKILQKVQGISQDLTQLNKLDIILGNQAELINKLNQQSELICRNFTRQWNYEMKKLEAECPNTFFLLPGSSKKFNPKQWVSEEYQLFLLCQHPPQPHQAGDGYKLSKAMEWWLYVSPWLNHALTFLKYAVPLAGGAEKIINPDLIKAFQDQIDLLEKILDDLPGLDAIDSISSVTRHTRIVEGQEAIGPALRALHTFLKEQDPNETWGNLHKTPTPDGNILWLCSDHRKQYEAKQAAFGNP